MRRIDSVGEGIGINSTAVCIAAIIPIIGEAVDKNNKTIEVSETSQQL